MADIAVTASWAGIPLALLQFHYSVGHGTSPGILSAIIPAQDVTQFPRIGTLTISDNVNPPIAFQGCRLTQVDPAGDNDSLLRLHWTDRRIAWANGAVDGFFNQRDPYPDPFMEDRVVIERQGQEGGWLGLGPKRAVIRRFKPDAVNIVNGPFIQGTERTPVDMMKVCLAALYETGAVINKIPLAARPEANWLGVPPAQALQSVADKVGARVVFQPVANRILVDVPDGSAIVREDVPYVSSQQGFKPPDPPPAIRVIGSPILWGDWYELEPVGYEADGRIVHISKLSYQPVEGWAKFSPGYHHVKCVQGDSPDLNTSKALAKQFVWRMWRHNGFAIGLDGVSDPRINWSRIVWNRQLELQDKLSLPEKDATGNFKTKPAKLWGQVFNKRSKQGQGLNFEKLTELEHPFSVDTARGLVITQDPVYFLNKNAPEQGNFYAEPQPHLYLRTSAKIRNAEHMQYVHGQWVKFFGPPQRGVPEATVIRNELTPVFNADRDTDPAANGLPRFKLRELQSNLDELDAAAKYYIAGEAAKYYTKPTASRSYVGWLAIDPNANISEVSWSVGPDGRPTTTISVGVEHTTWLPGYPERRRNESMLTFLKEDWVNNVLNIGAKARPG
jgi:hypothetical protein